MGQVCEHRGHASQTQRDKRCLLVCAGRGPEAWRPKHKQVTLGEGLRDRPTFFVTCLLWARSWHQSHPSLWPKASPGHLPSKHLLNLRPSCSRGCSLKFLLNPIYFCLLKVPSRGFRNGSVQPQNLSSAPAHP